MLLSRPVPPALATRTFKARKALSTTPAVDQAVVVVHRAIGKQ